jgi:hypothetical protein
MAKKKGLSKVDMVRDAIVKLGWEASTADYAKYIKATHNTEMSLAHISQTKSTERRRQGVRGKRRRRGRPSKAEAAATVHVAPAATVADIVSFLTTIREWEAKIGADTVREIVKNAQKK